MKKLTQVSYTVRLDENLHLKMKSIAKAERRSLNSQIEYFLAKSITDYETQNGELKVNPDDLYE